MVFKSKIAVYLFALIVNIGVRTCCGYIYPGNSAYGIFVAIAVPLNLPHRNVFVSYNFEANYNLPSDAKTIIPGPYQRFTPLEDMVYGEEVVNDVEVEDEVFEETGRKESKLMTIDKPNKRSKNKAAFPKALITRRAIYRILRDKLELSGFKGTPCLLKLICELNASMLGKNNGVFGSILHILLTPSTSSDENLPLKMYEAEENGVKGVCFQYENKCPHNIMDLLSAPIEDFLFNKSF